MLADVEKVGFLLCATHLVWVEGRGRMQRMDKGRNKGEEECPHGCARRSCVTLCYPVLRGVMEISLYHFRANYAGHCQYLNGAVSGIGSDSRRSLAVHGGFCGALRFPSGRRCITGTSKKSCVISILPIIYNIYCIIYVIIPTIYRVHTYARRTFSHSRLNQTAGEREGSDHLVT